MTTRTGARILVDQLLTQGCGRMFTVAGESFLSVLDALHDTPARPACAERCVARDSDYIAFDVILSELSEAEHMVVIVGARSPPPSPPRFAAPGGSLSRSRAMATC